MNKILQLYGKNLTEDVKGDNSLSVSSNIPKGINPILYKYGSNLTDDVKAPKITAKSNLYDDMFVNTPSTNERTNYINQRKKELEDEYAPLKNDRFGGLFKGKSSDEIEAIVNKNLQGYIKAYDKEQANKNKTIPTNSEDYKEFYKNDVLGDSNLPGFIKDFAANAGLLNTKLQQNPVTGRYIQAFNNNGQQEVTDDLGRTVEAPTTGNKVLDTLIDIPANVGANIVFNKGIGAGDFYKNTGVAADNLINRTGLQNPFLRSASREGVENALQEGLMSLSRGSDLGQVAKDTAIGGLQGAAFGGALEGAGRAVKKLSDLSVTDRQVIEDSIKKSPLLKQVKQVESQKPSSDIKGRFTIKNQSLEDAYKAYDDAVSTLQDSFGHYKLTPEEIIYGADELGIDLDQLLNNIDKAENTKISIGAMGERARMSRVAGANDSLMPKGLLNTSIPKSIENNLDPLAVKDKNISMAASIDKVNDSLEIPFQRTTSKKTTNTNLDTGFNNSSWKETVQNSNNSSPELRKLLEKTELTYKIKSNESTLDVARKMIDTDTDEAIRVARTIKTPTAESNAMSQLLMQRLQKEGRYNDVIDIIENTSKNATTQGQAIQALSMWGRLTPEGMLRHVQNTFDSVNEGSRSKKVGNLGKSIDGFQNKVGKELKLTPELVDKITSEMTDISKMEDGSYDKLFKTASLLADIDEMIPKSVSQKLSTIQAMAQLLNPKTVGRNIIGNTLFGQGLENASQVIATGLDKGIGAFTGNRTTTLPSLRTQAKSFKEGLSQGIKESLAGVNTTNVTGKYELGKQNRTFNRNTKLGKLETAMNVSLQAPDRAAYKAAYDDTLRAMTKANNGKVNDAMKAYADFTAKYRTFQDDSELSGLFKDLKDTFNRVGIGKKDWKKTREFGLGDLVLKYAKTPANILDRALDYSPLGVVKGTLRDKGTIGTQKAFVDAMGRSLTGSGVMLLGYVLNKEGVLTSKPASNKNEDRFNRQIGENPYSININALNRWISGGDTKQQQGDKYVSWDWAAPTALLFSMGGDISQSQKDGSNILRAATEGASTAANTLLEQPLFTGVSNLVAYGDLGQGLVSTALSAPTSFTPTALKQIAQLFDNTARNTYDPNPVKQSVNQVISKVPFASKTLEPQVTTFGEERKNYNSDGLKRGLDIFINPSFDNNYKTTETQQKIKEIAESTGDSTIYPKITGKKIDMGGQTLQLTPKEVREYQETVGKNYLSGAESIVNANKSDLEKAKQLESLYRKINDAAKEDIFKKNNIKIKK